MHRTRRMFTVISLLLLLTFSLSANAEDYETEFQRFKTFLKNHPVGRDGDAWLEILNAFGNWEPVVLVFGYPNDLSVCEGLIADLQVADRLPRDARCTRVDAR